MEPPAPRVGPGRVLLVLWMRHRRTGGAAAALTPAGSSWALSRPRFLPLCWVAVRCTVHAARWCRSPMAIWHGWKEEGGRLDPRGIGFVFVKQPNPLGPSGGHADARPPVVAGRRPGRCTRHHQLEAGLRLRLRHRRLPAWCFTHALVSASRSRTLWLGELEATAAARTGWTVAWPLRFFCDGPWVGWAAEREALGRLRGAEAKETGPRNGFGPAYALRFNLVCSEFQSVRTKLLPPVKFM